VSAATASPAGRGPSPGALVITAARLHGQLAEIRCAGGVITEIAASVTRRPGDRALAAAGASLLVGWHDHHVHLRSLAAAASSVAVGPSEVGDRAALIAVLRGAGAGAGRAEAGPAEAGPAETDWIRAVGYHESVAGLLDRAILDQWVPDRPLRVQHRSGALWVLNSLAVDRLGVEAADDGGIERDGTGRATGRLWRMDAWLGAQLRDGPAPADGRAVVAPSATAQAAALARHSRAAAAWGVTGFTDATPDRTDEDLASLAALSRDGVVGQRLHLMVRADQPAGRPEDWGDADRVTIGPVKIILDDDRLPTLPHLAATIRSAHGRHHPVAVHCVTAVQLVVTLAAFLEAGATAGDRIEHGAVIPAELIGTLAALPLVIVTQPGFVAARGDTYRAEVPAAEQADLWRAGSLSRAGVRVAAGSDAPHGPADPRVAIEAAVRRRTASGAVLGAEEMVDALVARRWWSGHAARPDRPRTVAVGAPADLVLAASGPQPGDAESAVLAAVVAGRVVYQA
jgi:predicted amidohydrolase YtcJ